MEDDADDALILREQLAESPARFEIVTVPRLAGALECLRAEPFDVILSDLSLPDSSGDGPSDTGSTSKAGGGGSEEIVSIVRMRPWWNW